MGKDFFEAIEARFNIHDLKVEEAMFGIEFEILLDTIVLT
jgi:hypothetical protein